LSGGLAADREGRVECVDVALDGDHEGVRRVFDVDVVDGPFAGLQAARTASSTLKLTAAPMPILSTSAA